MNNTDAFFKWHYGGAIIFDGLFRVNETFGINFEPILNMYLYMYKTVPKYYGYDVLHNITVPFYKNVGDAIGLFPINYLNSVIKTHGKDKDGLQIAKTVADQYILKWPLRIRDGTLSRKDGWSGEPVTSATFLWADDQYMGLTLVSRLASYLKNREYAEFVAKQRLLFNEHLQDARDGLFYHGYNDADGHLSCCKWGRGNGWSITASLEVALALKEFTDPDLQAMQSKVLTGFRQQAMGMMK